MNEKSKELRRVAKQGDDDGAPGPYWIMYESADEIDRLTEALAELLERHCELVNSGDCGNWDAETEPSVIKARAALGQ